jgi:hypothetical protein
VCLRRTILRLDRGNRPPHRFCLERFPRDTPRGTRNDLTGLDDLEVDQLSRRCGANAEDAGGLLECQQIGFRLCRRKRGPFIFWRLRIQLTYPSQDLPEDSSVRQKRRDYNVRWAPVPQKASSREFVGKRRLSSSRNPPDALTPFAKDHKYLLIPYLLITLNDRMTAI